MSTQATSVEQRTALKARLADLANLYCNSTIGSHNFTKHIECFVESSAYKKNDDIIITKPGKGFTVVILNKPIAQIK